MSFSKIFVLVLTALLAVVGVIDVPLRYGKILKIVSVVLIAIGIMIFTLVANAQEEKQILFRSGTCILQTKIDDTAGWMLDFGSNLESLPAKNQLAYDSFSVSIEGGNLNIQGTVRDPSKNILAYINGDTFHAQAAGIEFNCDDKAVEVKDSRGNVIFQLIIDYSQKIIHMYGITFPGGSGDSPACSTPSGFYVGVTDQSLLDKCYLKPIFQYPVGNTIGERVKQQ